MKRVNLEYLGAHNQNTYDIGTLRDPC